MKLIVNGSEHLSILWDSL